MAINLKITGLLELLGETGGNRGKVIVSKWSLTLHHAPLMLEQGMDNFHQLFSLINYSYEGPAALGGFLAVRSCKTDD